VAGDPNPLLLAVQRVREDEAQRRTLERALAEATPLERLTGAGRDRYRDRDVMRALPILAKGV
jgi:hypothetical protein